jgi:hypothetical protein
MASIKEALGTSTAITITLNSLASSATAGRESTAIDNSSNLYLDALVTVIINFPNSAPANDKAIYIYAYGSEDGTNYTDNATGSDAAITLESPTCLRPVHTIPIPTQNKSYEAIFSIAQVFGGILPRKWGIVVRNYAGQTLVASGNSASYSGVYATSA